MNNCRIHKCLSSGLTLTESHGAIELADSRGAPVETVIEALQLFRERPIRQARALGLLKKLRPGPI